MRGRLVDAPDCGPSAGAVEAWKLARFRLVGFVPEGSAALLSCGVLGATAIS